MNFFKLNPHVRRITYSHQNLAAAPTPDGALQKTQDCQQTTATMTKKNVCYCNAADDSSENREQRTDSPSVGVSDTRAGLDVGQQRQRKRERQVAARDVWAENREGGVVRRLRFMMVVVRDTWTVKYDSTAILCARLA